jgi:hypothetical protein
MFCFVTDNDGHWYKIPVKHKSLFEEWVECMYNDQEWEHEVDFENYRSMHPSNYMFNDVYILKENTNVK